MHSNLDGADPSHVWCCKESLCPLFLHITEPQDPTCASQRETFLVFTQVG